MRKNLIKKYCKDKDILDVGSGNCKLKEYAEARHYTSIDVIDNNYIIGNIEDYQFKRKFDTIVALGCFHQIHNIGLAMRNIRQHIKDNGILIVGVPYNFAWKYRFLGNRLVDPNAIRWYCKTTLRQLLEKYGFKTEHIYIY